MRVLVVDDKDENLYYLRVLLSAEGFEVECARHGAEALALAHANVPKLVISDLLMPVMDGYTLLRRWKADSQLRAVPFIVYTATYTAPEDEQLALSLGADTFILKPTEPDEFLRRVRAVLAGATTRAPSTPAPNSEGDGLLREYNETLIRKLEQKSLELEESNRSLQRDIAARERVESALRESEATLRHHIEELGRTAAQLRRTEEQLRQAQKMEALGRLAGGIAHDFNNLLTVIISGTVLALESEAPLRAELEQVRRAGERAAALTRQLLAFSRQQVLEPKLIDLGSLVREMEPLLRRLLGEDIELSIGGVPGMGMVHADPSQLEQVIMNLAVNARDAMPRGGKLSFETSVLKLPPGEPADSSPYPRVPPGSYVVLTVKDTGDGMSEETRQRIFEPFFTTKQSGTGLGLPTVFGIVEQSHGYIFVDSALGDGATFKILLPWTDRTSAPARVSTEAVAEARGSETILMVEDDDQVRTLNGYILRRGGYHVLEAANGKEAIARCETYEAPIHLLLTDVIMPHMSGRDLVDRVARMRPAMKVLYLSGYTGDLLDRRGALPDGVAFLEKPTTPSALLSKVRAVLAQ